jgi:hypothetical protein
MLRIFKLVSSSAFSTAKTEASVPPKRLVAFSGIHCVINQNIVLEADCYWLRLD